MQTNQKIFVVMHTDADCSEDIDAIFDEYSKAEAFMYRFKTKGTLKIVEFILNPEYVTDKERDPYNVVLKKTGAVPIDIFICNDNELTDQALNEEYCICVHDDNIDNATIELMLMATTETDALIRAIAIRDEIVATGKWRFAYYESLKNLSNQS